MPVFCRDGSVLLTLQLVKSDFPPLPASRAEYFRISFGVTTWRWLKTTAKAEYADSFFRTDD